VQGVSTCAVDDLVQAMGMSASPRPKSAGCVRRSTIISRLCAEIDDKVKAFPAGPIEGDWPYLWVTLLRAQWRRVRRSAAPQVAQARGLPEARRRQTCSPTSPPRLGAGASSGAPIFFS
jgi:putative transposase